MVLLRCSWPLLLLLLLRLLLLHWHVSFMGGFSEPHSMHLVALAVDSLDHRDALLPHGLAVRHRGDGSHSALLFELLHFLVLLLLGRRWRCFTVDNSVLDCGAGVSAGAAVGDGGDCGTGVATGGRAMLGRCRLAHWFVDGVQFPRLCCQRQFCSAPCECFRACRRSALSQTAQQIESVPTERGTLFTQIFQHACGEHQIGLNKTRC